MTRSFLLGRRPTTPRRLCKDWPGSLLSMFHPSVEYIWMIRVVVEIANRAGTSRLFALLGYIAIVMVDYAASCLARRRRVDGETWSAGKSGGEDRRRDAKLIGRREGCGVVVVVVVAMWS